MVPPLLRTTSSRGTISLVLLLRRTVRGPRRNSGREIRRPGAKAFWSSPSGFPRTSSILHMYTYCSLFAQRYIIFSVKMITAFLFGMKWFTNFKRWYEISQVRDGLGTENSAPNYENYYFTLFLFYSVLVMECK